MACLSPLPTRPICEVLTSLRRCSLSSMEAVATPLPWCWPQGQMMPMAVRCAKQTVTWPKKCLYQHRPRDLLQASILEVSRYRKSGPEDKHQDRSPSLCLSNIHVPGPGRWLPQLCPRAGHCLQAGLEPQITNRKLLQIHPRGHKDHVCQPQTRSMDEQISASSQRLVLPPGSLPG